MTHLIDGNVIVVNTRNALKEEWEKEFGIVQQTACRFNGIHKYFAIHRLWFQDAHTLTFPNTVRC